MQKNKLLRALTAGVCLLLMLTACGSSSEKKPADESNTQNIETPAYEFPENGVLRPLHNGDAPYAPDGLNPSFVVENATDKILVFFDFADKGVGLDLSENTEIFYKVKTPSGKNKEGSTKLDTSIAEIKTENGYIGILADVGMTFDKFERVAVEFKFRDNAGKEFTLESQTIMKGLSYYGLSADAFDKYLGGTVETSVSKNAILQSGEINGTKFNFNITLGSWSGKTTAEQIVIISRLFWETYPRMYARFGAAGESPTKVTLDIEDGGYEIASAGGNQVHLHDGWLQQNPTDFDCLTHEFAHVIQNGWDGDYCEYSGYIERFADYCRYIYAFQSGLYNDDHWEMQTINSEKTRETSVRFLAWLDYYYSTEDIDLVLRFFNACRDKNYRANEWDAAWAEIFAGTLLEGKKIDVVFETFAKSEFAKLSSHSKKGATSPLLDQFSDLRTKRA